MIWRFDVAMEKEKERASARVQRRDRWKGRDKRNDGEER